MVSSKVLLVSACLIAAVYGKATIDLAGKGGGLLSGVGGGHSGGGLVGGLLGGGQNGGGLLSGNGGLLGGLHGGFVGILNTVFQGIGAKLKVEGAILNDLLHLKIPATIDDVLNLVRVVALTFSKVVYQVFPGFGVVLGGFSSSIVRIAICLLGSPGFSGLVLSDHRPGAFNPRNLNCNGLPNVGHGGKGSVDLSKYSKKLGLDEIIRKAKKLIIKIKGNRDLHSLPRSQVVVITHIQFIIKLLEKKDFSSADLTVYIKYFIIITASITNSLKSGAGDAYAINIVSLLEKVIKKHGYASIADKLYDIQDALKGTSDNSNCWTTPIGGSNNENNESDDRDNSNSGDRDNSNSGERDSSNNGSGDRDSGNNSSGDRDSSKDGSGEHDSNNNGSGEHDSNNNGSGEHDSNNNGNGEHDSNNNGSGEHDSNNNGSGEHDSNNNGSGEHDSNNNGSGEHDSNNNGSGEHDSNNNGSGDSDSGNKGSGDHSKYESGNWKSGNSLGHYEIKKSFKYSEE